MKLKQFFIAFVAMVLCFSFTASAQQLLVNCDYNSSTEGYGTTKFSNYAGAYAYATANAKTATIVIEKTNTLSGNTFDNNHKNYSKLAVVIKDGAEMGNAASKWDMTYPVTVEPGGTLTCARPKSASVSNIHIKNKLIVGAMGATKKAYVNFLSDSYQDCDISIRYNGSIEVYNADFEVQDLDAQGKLTIEDSNVKVDGAFASTTSLFYPTTITNTEMVVNGNQISGGLSDFAGGTSNQLGNVKLNNSTLTIKEGDTKVAANVTATNSHLTVNNLTVNNGKTLNLNEGSTLTAENITTAGTGSVKIDGQTATIEGGQAYIPVAKIDDVEYKTLEAAFAAATEGQTITMLVDATPALSSQRAITKAAVIDLGGKTMTLTEDDLYFGTTTFKNGTIVVDPSVKPSTAVFWMFKNQTLTFDNVKIVATGVTGTYLIGLDGDNSDLNLLNGSEIVVENTSALDLDIICVNASTGNDIKVENSKVNVTNLDGRVFFRGNYTVKDSEVNLEGITKAGFRIEAGQTLSIEGTSKVNITGEPPRDGGIHLTDVTAKYTKAETATVNATVNRPAIAKIGDTPYYTFAEAAAAAQAGSEIKLLANIEGDITVPANVTLNGNGFAINGAITADGTITFAGVTKADNFGVKNVNTVVNIPAGASLQLTGTGRMVIGHGCTFNITGSIADNAAKTADKATLTPSLVMPGASFTGAGVTFNVTNAYISAPSSYCSSKSASGTFDFNITNSIWDSAGKLAFEAQSTAAKVDFALVNSVLTTGSHLVFATASGEEGVVIDNSLVNQGTSRQIENRGTMTIKNGAVVNGAVATSSNAINPGTIIVENATYAVTGEFSGAAEGTGNLIIKKGANVSVGSIKAGANVTVDAEGMTAGDEINFTADLSQFTGTLSVINNDKLEASIVDGKVVLAAKPVAQIGTTSYATLEEAFKAANAILAGCTIDILSDVTVDYAWDCRKTGSKFTVPVTINGNDKTIKFTASVNDNNYQAPFRFEQEAIVKNLIVDMSEVTDARFRAISSKNNLTVDGCKFIGKDETLNCRAIIFGEGAGTNVGNLAISITNSEFINWKRGITDNENAQDVKTVTITGNTLTEAGVGVSAKETVTFTGNTVSGAYVNIKSYTAGNKLAVTATGNTLEANTDAAYNVIDAGGVVNAEGFKVVAKGNNFNGYTSTDGIWGEVWGNARESFVIKVLDANGNVMGTTSLNNVGGIIDGDVNVSWNLKFNAAANTDEYWTMAWTTAPTLDNMPAKVELWVDGTRVSGGDVLLNGPDDLNKIYTIVTDAEGKITSCHTTVANALAAAKTGETVTIFEGTYKVPAMKAGITVEGKGKVLLEGTLSGTLENLTLKNLHIKGGNAQRWAYGKGNLVFENVTFEATSVYALHFDGITEGTKLTYKDCTIIGWAAMGGKPESCVFDGCTIKGNGTYGVIRTYFNTTIKDCTFDVANVSTTDAYEDGIHAVDGAEVVVDNCTNANGDMKDIVNVHGTSVVTVDGVEIKNAAKIGDKYYTTLEEAFKAAQAGDTVTILAGTYPVPAMKAGITVVGEGEVLLEGTLSGTLENLTLKNLHIKGGNAQRWAYGKGDLVFENVTFEATSVYALHFDGITAGTNLTYKNCTIIGWAAMGGSPASCVFDGCTIKGNGTYGVIRTYFDTTIENCTFDVANVSTTDAYEDGIHAVDGAEVVVNNCTNANGDMKDIVNVHGTSVVTVDGVEIKNAAKIGDKYYTTLEEAFKAAKAGDTVTILAGTYPVPAMKAGITVVGEGEVLLEGTLSGTLENLTLKNLHIKGGNAQRWAYGKGNLVFEDVTFEATSVYALHFDGITAGTNLTYKNCTIIGWAAMGGSPASCVFDGCTIKGNGTYGVIRTYFDTTIKGCTFDVANVSTTDAYEDGIHAVDGAEVVVNNCTNANGDMKDIVNVHGTSVVTVDGVEIKNAAKIGDKYYTTLEEALTAAADGETVTLIWSEGNDPIDMNGSVFGKDVTITGTAKVDWSKGWLFVGRGGEGNATVTFDGANLTSASNNATYGIHVSGREKETTNKYDGTLVIKNSTIELDFLINRNAIELDNATFTVKNGFGIAGRPASETESGANATATISLANNSKVVVNNHNGMGLGQAASVLEGMGVMNIDETSTFETTQGFVVTANGTMNIAGTAIVAGTLTNNGVINLTAEGATLEAQEGLNIATTLLGYFVKYANGVYTVCGEIVLVDGEEFVNEKDMTVKTLTYTRGDIKDTWTPFYVPFAVPVSELPDDFDVAYINAVRRRDGNSDGVLDDDFTMEIIFIHCESKGVDGSGKILKPNYPYFIRSKSESGVEMNITLDNAVLYAAKENVFDCTTMTEKFEIKGNYHQIPSDKFTENDYVVGGGVWGNIISGYSLKPFRFYMTMSSRDGSDPTITTPMKAMKIVVCGEEDENGATIIYDVVEDSLNGNDFIYDLQGRRVAEPKKGGIYIKNGKKILY